MLSVIFHKAIGERVAKTAFNKHIYNLIVNDKKKFLNEIVGTVRIQNNTGQCLWPDARRDAEVGIRFGWGTPSKDKDGLYWRSFDLQINRNASNPTLRSLASGNQSHVKRVTILLQTDKDGVPMATQDEIWDQLMEKLLVPASTSGF